jgi:cold shock CspA family protein
MADNWKKKERENKKQQSKKSKEEKKQVRKENRKDGNDLDSMIAYIDENGNLSSKPPDPTKKKVMNAEDIVIGVPKQRELSAEELIRKGKVSFFNVAKGYGFIKDNETGESIFVHASSIDGQINENDKVSFEIESGPKGPVAVNIKLIN